MSAADAQWIVVGFLNLACQIAVVMLLAGGAEVLVKRSGAGPKAFVWTMALVSLVVMIGARLASSPITRGPVRFAEARQDTESEWSRFDFSEEVAERPGGVFAEHRMSELRESEGQEGAFPNAMEVVSTERVRESPGNDLIREKGETGAPTLWERDPEAFSAASRRRSADAPASVGGNEKINSWQVAGWGVAALCLVSALLLLRVLIGTLTLKNLILRWRARDASAALNGTLDELKRVLGMKRRVRLLISPKNGAPIAFGTFRPTIILPAGLMERIGTEGVRQMLSHELAHVRRYDSLVILLQRVCMALCFWHPLVHVANRRLRILIEDACDDCVLRITREPRAYADCLTKLAEQKLCRLPGIAGWIGTKHRRLKLERRIQKILNRGRPLGRVSAVAAMAMVVAAAIVSLVSSRIPLFGIAGEEAISAGKMQAAEAEVLTPLEGETPLKHAQRLLMEGYASPAIEVLRKAIGESDDPGTATGLRYELARAYHLLVNTQNLEKTLSEIWATVPADVREIAQFADFCIDTGQERLAREAVERLQELEPDKRVYHASKLYGAFPKPEELWIPFQPKPLEKSEMRIGEEAATIYKEQLIRLHTWRNMAADLEGDGTPETIFFGTSQQPKAMLAIFSPEGELLWKVEEERGGDIGTIDWDGDEKQEIVATGASTVSIYDCGGRPLWQGSRDDYERERRRKSPVVRSPEGADRRIVRADDSLKCLLEDGTVDWEIKNFRGRIRVADLDANGWDEIVAVTPARPEDVSAAIARLEAEGKPVTPEVEAALLREALSTRAKLVVFDRKGREIPSKLPELRSREYLGAVDDFDGDGTAEIVIVRHGRSLTGYDTSGEVVWDAPMPGQISGALFGFAAGDMDGDGKKEIAYYAWGLGAVGVTSVDGAVRFELATKPGGVMPGDPQFADVDGDGKNELFVGTYQENRSYLLCVGPKGDLLWRFPMLRSYGGEFHAAPAKGAGSKGVIVARYPDVVLSAKGEVISAIPTAAWGKSFPADFDGDGKKEIAVVSSVVRAYDVAGNRGLWGGVAPEWRWQPHRDRAAAIDVDGDGADELIFECRGYVCVVNGEGKLVRTGYIGEYGEAIPSRIDVDGDGKDEILITDDRRFVVLNRLCKVVAVVPHPKYREWRGPIVAAGNLDSHAGDEIIVARDPGNLKAYSTKGPTLTWFRRPSWLPLHPDYDHRRLGYYGSPQLLRPMDVNRDDKNEVVGLIDRLFVWNPQGQLADVAFNDYPSRGEVFAALLIPRMKSLLAYLKDLAAFPLSGYLEKAEETPVMELYYSALPIRADNEMRFLISGEQGLKLLGANGKIVWEAREEMPPVNEIGFGDFNGDGEKEILISGWTKSRDKDTRMTMRAYSEQGKRLLEGEIESWHLPVYDDLDGDGFMEVALGHDAGIAVLDMTP